MANKKIGKKQAEMLVFKKIKQMLNNACLFTGINTGYTYITWEVYPEVYYTDIIKSERFETKLMMLCIGIHDGLYDSKFINSLVRYIHTQASLSEVNKKVYSRIGMANDSIIYNLNNANREYIMVNANNVMVIRDDCLVDMDCAFVSNELMGPQVMPVIKEGNNLYDLLDPFLNLNDDAKKLLVVCIVAWFIHDIPKAVFLFQGEQGSGKTFLTSLVQRIVDPVNHDVLYMPETKEDLGVALSTHYVMAVDNISSLPKGVSDLLCQASTGGSMLKRTKYSNFNASVVTFKNCVLLNGISIDNARLDLRDRIVGFELPTLHNKYCSAKELEEQFDKQLPFIMGEIFRVLKEAMNIHETLKPMGSARLIDFFNWGRAIAIALFGSDAEFKRIFLDNKGFVFEELIEADSLGHAFKIYLEGIVEFPHKVNATDLYLILKKIAQANHLNTNSVNWVNSPSELSNKLKRLLEAFRGMGYEVDISSTNKSNGIRYIKIGKIAPVTVSSSAADGET